MVQHRRFSVLFEYLVTGLLLAAVGGFTLSPAAAEDRPATTLSGPHDRGGTNVEDVRQLRFQDANGDSHVFEVEELPSWASGDRAGAFQVSPVARATYDRDTDYLLIHPKSGAIDLGGGGPLRLHGSPLRGADGLRLRDRNGDGFRFLLREITSTGPLDGLVRLGFHPGPTLLIGDPRTGNAAFANGLGIRGTLGVRGLTTTLGEPLEADGNALRGLAFDPCETCAVRRDFVDADMDGTVDRAHSVRSLEASVGCESGQLCSETTEVTVPAGATKKVSFERTFSSGLPRIIRNETFAPGEESPHRVPALTIEEVQRGAEGSITGLMIRNGHADEPHTGTIGIQGVVE